MLRDEKTPHYLWPESTASLLPEKETTQGIRVAKVQQFISLGPLESSQVVGTLHGSQKPTETFLGKSKLPELLLGGGTATQEDDSDP